MAINRPNAFFNPEWRSVQVILIFALICGVLGIYPHMLFGFHTGLHTPYQGAWDELLYLLTLYDELPEWNSYPVKRLLASVISALEPSKRIFAILADFLLPMIAATSAGILALHLFRNPIPVLTCAFALLFGSEIFEFNSSVLSIRGVSLQSIFSGMTIFQKQFFVDAYSSFLSLYRTPEPQLSISFFFIHLAGLIAFVSNSSIRVKIFVPLLLSSIICAGIYAFFSLASLALSFAAIFALLVSGDRKYIISIICTTLVGLVSTLFVVFNYYSNEANSMLFNTRYPMISLGALYGLLAIGWLFFHYKITVFRNATLLFSFCLFSFPILVLNQQLITGVMIQSLNWERYINIPLVIVGLANMLRVKPVDGARFLKIEEAISRFERWYKIRNNLNVILAAQLLLVIAFIFQSQWRAYTQFISYNLLTEAYAQSMSKELKAEQSLKVVLTLDNMHYDAAIKVRSHMIGNRLDGYTGLISKPNNDIGQYVPGTESFVKGFEIAARLGLTAEQYRQRLDAELKGNYCWPHLMYLTTFLKCAPYVSDFRKYDPLSLRELIDQKVSAYSSFLSDNQRQNDQPGLVFSSIPLDFDAGNSLWDVEQLSVTNIATSKHWILDPYSSEVYAYRQMPRRVQPE